MRVVNKSEFFDHLQEYLSRIKSGSVFIYPTDTIYGIGCNAMIDGAVQKIRDIKSRYTLPFSIIAPSKQWIKDHCEITPEAEEWLEKLPGPYTLILRLKDKSMISSFVNNNLDTVGVRLPDHWFTKVVEELGYPIITTSANHIGGNYMTELEDLEKDIEARCDFIIYEGEIQGKPSQLLDFTKEELNIVSR